MGLFKRTDHPLVALITSDEEQDEETGSWAMRVKSQGNPPVKQSKQR